MYRGVPAGLGVLYGFAARPDLVLFTLGRTQEGLWRAICARCEWASSLDLSRDFVARDATTHHRSKHPYHETP